MRLRIPTARSYLEKAAGTPGAVLLTVFDLCILCAQAQHLPQAEERFRQASKMDADNPDARLRLSRVLQAEGQTAEARAELEKVRQLHESKDEALVKRMSHADSGSTP